MSATQRWLMSMEQTISGPGSSSTTSGPMLRSSIMRAIRRVGIGGEDQLFGRAVQDAEHLVGHQADLLVALDDGGAGNRGIEKLVSLDRPVEIGIVIGALDRLRCRTPVLDDVFTVTH